MARDLRRGRHIQPDRAARGRRGSIPRDAQRRRRRALLDGEQYGHACARGRTRRAALHDGRRDRQKPDLQDARARGNGRKLGDPAGGVSKLGGRGAQGRGECGDGSLQDALRGQRNGPLVQVGRGAERLYRHGRCRDRPEGRDRPRWSERRAGSARHSR